MMNTKILMLAFNLLLSVNLFSQNKSEQMNEMLGSWFVESMCSDTIVLNKNQVVYEESVKSSVIIFVTFYDETFHRIDKLVFDKNNYEQEEQAFVEKHEIIGNTVRFGSFFSPIEYSIVPDGSKKLLFIKTN